MEKNNGYFIAIPLSITGENWMGYSDNLLEKIHYTYLHGALEDKNGYDIFAFLRFKPTLPGIYPVMVLFPDKAIESTLFLWINELRSDRNLGITGFSGLLVANDDPDTLLDAKTKYAAKPVSI